MDLGSTTNWTITSWPVGGLESSLDPQGLVGAKWTSKYGTVGFSGNWIGDEHYGFYSLFGDSINENGLSCGQLTLVGSVYEKPSPRKTNVFYGVFCKWATQLYSSVEEVYSILPDVAIWGPDILAEHFILRDASGASLVIELIGGKQQLHLDLNDQKSGYGIMTNEPAFDYHLTNIEHYEWKRTLARQAVPVPGSWYPEERFLRIHMVKSGMQNFGLNDVTSFQEAFALTAQVLNTVQVPYGEQYGTDTGEASGEGEGADHTQWAIIRDHKTPAIYWRDANNPTFRGMKLSSLNFAPGSSQFVLKLEEGPFYIDVASYAK